MTVRLEGVLPIIPTPFDSAGQVDQAALRKLAEHAVATGAAALVYPGVASEDVQLTAEERKAALDIVVGTVAGRRPVLAGINAAEPETMVELARSVAATGVDGVMAMAIPAMGDETEAWFHRIAEALDGGIIVLQNLFAPRGADLSAEEMLSLARAVPAIRYVKEEGVPSGPKVSQLVAGCGPDLDGVIGGGGARYLYEELVRGAVATMPALELLEIHVALMRAWAVGDKARALDLYERTLPLLLIQAPYRMRLTKLILRDQGLCATADVREALPEMDPTLEQLILDFHSRAMAALEPAHA
ncbi:dihydrodipicolinate synthase family protein [Mesobaculum littorinae]|uniref:Dihydrodipicolinate synthase family protein n=1 Tax=Mesobaculum littorinae TaxID=2486419 RepID=A0A438AKV8_9RHOB|nr:dihydrodipicolinate synthase family protein [Mesobaculum littorinae]RVV99461.1 dihydrodipicolinate synthase family protein [Mesobaculum littorinae]